MRKSCCSPIPSRWMMHSPPSGSTSPASRSETSPGSRELTRCILFVDCDRFYFAVEAAERPGLAGERRAVIIGRDPREAPRGIVTTANDPARAVGIHSGMPAATALRLAPDALFLPPRHHVYAQYSARVMAVLRDESPLVQQSSIDEAACAWPYGFIPEPPLALRERILNETGISVSLGLATSPLVAKMASEVAKKQADHLWIVRPGEDAAFLAALPMRGAGGGGAEGGGDAGGGGDHDEGGAGRAGAGRRDGSACPRARDVLVGREPRDRYVTAGGGAGGEEHLRRAHISERHDRPASAVE